MSINVKPVETDVHDVNVEVGSILNEEFLA